MFDPHRLRANDRRYFTRKGQVIQAKNISAPFAIERNKVEAYKQYILKNDLIDKSIFQQPLVIDTIQVQDTSTVQDFTFYEFDYNNTGVTTTYPLDEGYKLIVMLYKPFSDSENIRMTFIVTEDTSVQVPWKYLWKPIYLTRPTAYVNLRSGGTYVLSLNMDPEEDSVADYLQFNPNLIDLALPAPFD